MIRDFSRAEKRPLAGFEITAHQIDNVARPSIVVPVPSRIIWPLVLPRRGLWRAFVAAAPGRADLPAEPVRLRVGISDHRIYAGLADIMLTPGTRQWTEFRTDLSTYAGWKWSLFYRPDRITWRLVLAADATGGSPAIAIWGSPEIVTDGQSAREYTERRRQLAGR